MEMSDVRHARSRMTAIATITAAALLVGACSHMPRMPWQKEPPPPPQPVEELVEMAVDGTPTHAFMQYWKRNTLVLDMQGAASTGSMLLKPREGTAWPVRIAFRIVPGSIGQLEVRAEQRVLIPVTTEGTTPVDLELAPGVYSP